MTSLWYCVPESCPFLFSPLEPCPFLTIEQSRSRNVHIQLQFIFFLFKMIIVITVVILISDNGKSDDI